MKQPPFLDSGTWLQVMFLNNIYQGMGYKKIGL